MTWKPNPKWHRLPTWDILSRSDIAICVLYRLEYIYICIIWGIFSKYVQRVVIIPSINSLYSYLRSPIQPNRHCQWTIMVTYSVTSLWCVVVMYSLKFRTYSIMILIWCISMIRVHAKIDKYWCMSDIHTVETLYSTIYYSKYFIELNFDKSTQYVAPWTYKRHPIPRPFGRAMECLLWVFQQKLTVL